MCDIVSGCQCFRDGLQFHAGNQAEQGTCMITYLSGMHSIIELRVRIRLL